MGLYLNTSVTMTLNGILFWKNHDLMILRYIFYIAFLSTWLSVGYFIINSYH